MARVRRDHRDSCPSAQRQPECRVHGHRPSGGGGEPSQSTTRRSDPRRREGRRRRVRVGALPSPAAVATPAWPRPAAAARSTTAGAGGCCRRLQCAPACADRTRNAKNHARETPLAHVRVRTRRCLPSWFRRAPRRDSESTAPRLLPCCRLWLFFWCSLRARSFLRHLRRAALPRASRFLDNLRSTLRLIITRCCFRLRGGAAETEKGDCSHSAALGSKHKKHSRRGGRILLLLFGRAVVFVLRGSRRSQARSGDVLVPL